MCSNKMELIFICFSCEFNKYELLMYVINFILLFNSHILNTSLNIWTVNIKNVCLYENVNPDNFNGTLFRIEDNFNNNQNIAIDFIETFCI